MKVTVQKVLEALSRLLPRVEAGEEVAKPVATSDTPKVLPDLAEFRASLELKGEPSSQTVVRMRRGSRY